MRGQVVNLGAVNGSFRLSGSDGLGIDGPACGAPRSDDDRIDCGERLRIRLDPTLNGDFVVARIGFLVTDGEEAFACVKAFRDGFLVGKRGIRLSGGTTKTTIDFGVPFDVLRVDALDGAFSVVKMRLQTTP